MFHVSNSGAPFQKCGASFQKSRFPKLFFPSKIKNWAYAPRQVFAVGAQKTHRVLKSHEIAAFRPFLIDLKKSQCNVTLKG